MHFKQLQLHEQINAVLAEFGLDFRVNKDTRATVIHEALFPIFLKMYGPHAGAETKLAEAYRKASKADVGSLPSSSASVPFILTL